MAIIIYVISVSLLFALGRKYGTKPRLMHASYTGLLYPALYLLLISIVRKDYLGYGGRMMLLYGRARENSLFIMHLAAKASSAVMFSALPVILDAFAGHGNMILVFSLAMPVIGFMLPDIDLAAKTKKRKREVMRDYPVFCTELAIFSGAGMPVEQAWIKASGREGGEFYSEAKKVSLKNSAGILFRDALREFSANIAFPEIHTFVSIISQEIKAGGGNLKQLLRECAMESWKASEDEIRKKGGEAESKMIFPLALGLAGIIMILAAPAVMLMKGI